MGTQDGDPPKKTTRAIKRAKAKARKQQQFKQLQAIAKGKGKQQQQGGGKPTGGGQQTGGGKQQKGQVCFSYGRRRDGACCALPIGTEACPQGRLHECEFCHKKDHFSKDCPQKPARIKDW